MNKRIEALRDFIWNRKHHAFRTDPEVFGLDTLSKTFMALAVPPVERSARMLEALLNAEAPVILRQDRLFRSDE